MFSCACHVSTASFASLGTRGLPSVTKASLPHSHLLIVFVATKESFHMFLHLFTPSRRSFPMGVEGAQDMVRARPPIGNRARPPSPTDDHRARLPPSPTDDHRARSPHPRRMITGLDPLPSTDDHRARPAPPMDDQLPPMDDHWARPPPTRRIITGLETFVGRGADSRIRGA